MWNRLGIFKVELLLEQRFSNYRITAPRVTKNLIKKIEHDSEPLALLSIWAPLWGGIPHFLTSFLGDGHFCDKV